MLLNSALISLFLSTPSARRATTAGAMQMTAVNEFLSTPSARRATEREAWLEKTMEISIHALREEGDQGSRPDRQAHAISIHALREEGDEQEVISMLRKEMNFYPRPPRGGRHSTTGGSGSDVLFLSTPSAL